MGLAMYITAEKYLSTYGDNDTKQTINAINELFGIASDGDFTVSLVTFQVAYWGKANAIHGWFVHNVQGGRDECQKSYVSRDQLKELLTLCKAIKRDHANAETLLPAMGGFFFGSTEYGENYYTDVDDTIKQIERILNSPALSGSDFYYQASW